jgi:hypothetical protein
MVQIAQGAQNSAPRDPLAPPAAIVMSSYAEALDTVSNNLLLLFNRKK